MKNILAILISFVDALVNYQGENKQDFIQESNKWLMKQK